MIKLVVPGDLFAELLVTLLGEEVGHVFLLPMVINNSGNIAEFSWLGEGRQFGDSDLIFFCVLK